MQQQWLDRTAYPFAPHYAWSEQGRMHYVDEGNGPVVVMVHGTPVWSFLYRALIKDLARDYRCVAPDHIGFGLSDKPADASYKPEAVSKNLSNLINQLGLRDITLIVHDFGGPIGLGYALDHIENIRRLVIFNTWMWPMDDEPQAIQMSKLFGSWFGRWLYTRVNVSPRFLYPMAFGDKSKLRPEVQRHYVQSTSSPSERIAMWTFAREIIGSSDWYAQLWAKRDRLRHVPTLLLWGMKDPAFPPKQLARWQSVLPHAQTVTFPNNGHFLQEEVPDEVLAAIRAFLATT